MSPEWPKGPTEPLIQDFKRSEVGTSSMDSRAAERPPITEPERERIERELVTLGELMDDSSLWWQLDGTLSASLYRKEQGGDYIGTHSDIDMSVLRSELPALEDYLKEKGYGLFLVSRRGEERMFRRIGHETFTGRFLDDTREAPYIAAIDEGGTVRTDADLIRVQIAIVDRDSEGNPSERGVSYPKEWLEGKTIELNGVPIVLSHPARYLFFKLWHTRGYDDADIQAVAHMNLLSKEELDTLERIVLEKLVDPTWWEENKHFKKDEQLLRSRLAVLREFQQASKE